MSPQILSPIQNNWEASGLTIFTVNNWHKGVQRGGRKVCTVACEAIEEDPAEPYLAAQSLEQGFAVAALIAEAPEMLRILRRLTLQADLGEVDLDPEDAQILRDAEAVIDRIDRGA